MEGWLQTIHQREVPGWPAACNILCLGANVDRSVYQAPCSVVVKHFCTAETGICTLLSGIETRG